ncbi:hypothetical protein BDV28DRAFT_141121 [Aspergillus coremiiformis]|uniref:Uncharacterized protein n=1 Tax=Aspergillus coremiiformis TaxID=138285 RepID=A0A5N6YVH2_9EURO|nr:hypothetical protein BDV28DRAFT_141121 [Aspergillus coremiiformis]
MHMTSYEMELRETHLAKKVWILCSRYILYVRIHVCLGVFLSFKKSLCLDDKCVRG